MDVNFVIYHGNCPDGFCAAFVAKKKYPEAELFAATHGSPPPDVAGKDVLMVDFSYPRETLVVMAASAKSLHIFDHHKTAEEGLAGLDFATFDMGRSGAGLTWDLLFPGQQRPWYVSYVEDRDLWRWSLPESKQVSGYLMALPQTMDAWGALDNRTSTEAVAAGYAIRTHIDHYIDKVRNEAQRAIVHGHRAAIVNAAYPNISDVCNDMLADVEIAVGYFEGKDGKVQFSLRSNGDLDVSEIAMQYGGGGHKNASGFRLPYDEARRLIDSFLGR